jgi:hypothetical protein
MRNVELLTRTIQYIKNHPEEWDQSTFICDTAACFAGRAALLSGWSARDIGRNWDMFGTGAQMLGLTRTEVVTMFAPWNTIPMLEWMVRDLVSGNVLRNNRYYRELVS